MFDINKMKEKVLLMSDPNSGYTQEDFDKEFNFSKLVTPIANEDLYKVKLEFVNNSKNQNPEYATNGSSAFDLRASLTEPMVIDSGEYKVVPTGLYFNIPENMEIQIRSRSGLAAKDGVCVLNGLGTIDNDYTGEIKVILINHGEYRFTINNGDRIAQAVVASVIGKNILKMVQVDNIDKNTDRLDGGFGHTGVK
jgi:dUTP pyrophosphatase